MKALKEWAIVCKALGQGRQIFIARKGGILDEQGEFSVEEREFFLFPTYLHQGKEALKPAFHLEYELVSSEQPRDGRLHLSHYARVTDVIRVTRIEGLPRLSSEHIWGEEVMRGRFEWGPLPGLTLLVLRVFRLAEPVILPMKSQYGGCQSWVTLEKEVSLASPTPALSDREFARKRETLLNLLQTPA